MTPPAGQRWTRNKPTEPGWYWHKHAATGLMGVALIEQRTASTTGNFLFCSFLSDDGLSSACVLTKIKDGEWQGPLTPNEATE